MFIHGSDCGEGLFSICYLYVDGFLTDSKGKKIPKNK